MVSSLAGSVTKGMTVAVGGGSRGLTDRAGLMRGTILGLRELGAEAVEIQLQQSDADGDHHWPFTPQRNREGRIVADRVIDALRASGASTVTLILEVIPAPEQADDAVLDDLERSVTYWQEAIARR